MRRSGTVIIVALGCAAAGCPKDEPPADDRALRILKAERDRQANGGAPVQPRPATAPAEDPNARLAEIVSGKEGEKKLPVPANTQTVHVGTLAVKLVDLSTAHTAGGGRVQLSTEQLFLKVHLITQNVGEKPASFDFSYALVEADKHPYPIARDVTRAAGTRDLKHEYGVNDRQEVDLYFEVPPEALGAGSALVLPAAIGGSEDLRIALE
ncbi:MAG TPA: hypothetical protein VH208_00665 [Myxococcaceae bacterium]|nr:hypothetical protein [Myxococcaceae bacterium]